MDVWIIESVGFDRLIWGVASSVEAAAKFMRDICGSQDIVKWDPPVRVDDDRWTLTGQFVAVAGLSCHGPETFDFTRFTLDKARPWLR